VAYALLFLSASLAEVVVGTQSKATARPRSAWFICLCCLWLAGITAVKVIAGPGSSHPQATPKTTQAPKKPAAPQATSPTATYVGDDKCNVCHEPQKAGYANSLHARAGNSRAPAAKHGCETCHGPGSEHADDPVNKKLTDIKKLASPDVNAICTTCHTRGEHTMWDGSKHEARGLNCTTCHSIHSPQSKTAQLKAPTEAQVCATCHRGVVAKLDRVAHMPVSEGVMTCSSCHNPHGSTNVRLLKTGESVNELCTTCHADKRGPFLWEHAPVRQGCTTCHDPHGSQNDSMLVSKQPLLCQRCHISSRHPSTLYDSTQLAKPQLENRGCVNCHIQIHGSQHPTGQFFLR
jgi:DmsE family decaheme c-type cytochrome